MGLHYQAQKHTQMKLSLHASVDNTACTSCKPVGDSQGNCEVRGETRSQYPNSNKRLEETQGALHYS